MKTPRKHPTYSQIIAGIRKEFNCSVEEAKKINHQRNLQKVRAWAGNLKEEVKKSPAKQAIWKKEFGRELK